MADIVAIVRAVAPLARTNYVAALARGADLLAGHGIGTPKRLAHFLAQILHESAGLRVEHEIMNYRAARLLEIFGRSHSAKVTAEEAARLAGNPEALAERVYGLGNPRKAAELGNTVPGDGFRYRGGGLMQTTGRGNYRRIGAQCGVDLETRPALIVTADHALKPALIAWTEGALNDFADRDDLVSISRRINFGTVDTKRIPIGLAARRQWLRKVEAAMLRSPGGG